jgi:predicted CopG family antitoxin
MIGITITAEAYAAIKATLPADTQTWPVRPPVICLDQATVDRLSAIRNPGESYSDVILRLAGEPN